MPPLKSQAARSLFSGARLWSSTSNGHKARQVVVEESWFRPGSFAFNSATFSTVFLATALGLVYRSSSNDAKKIDPSNNVYGDAWYRQRKLQEEFNEGTLPHHDHNEQRYFVPVWWPRERAPKPYAPDSPEWKSFEELHNDRERQEEIASSITNWAANNVLNNKDRAISQAIGYGKVKVNMKNHFEYPTHPPKDYIQPGIGLSSSGITWTRKILTSQQYSRLEQFALPQAMGNAVLEWNRSYLQEQYKKLKRSLSFASGKERPSKSPSNSSNSRPSEPANTVPKSPDGKQRDIAELRAFTAFVKSLLRSKQPVALPGTCVVNVVIEIIGPRGRCVLLARGHYLPKQDAFTSLKLDRLFLHSHGPSPARIQAGNTKPPEPRAEAVKVDDPQEKTERKPPEAGEGSLKVDDRRPTKSAGEQSKPD
ncbi:MAG: hypothetical protein Q9227_005372 [Pyrenula ochraceoflavens]